MAIAKFKYGKDWAAEVNPHKSKKKKRTMALSLEVIKSEDLPEMLTAKAVALMLKRHPKTIEGLRKERKIKFVKLGGRYFSTPEWVAEYLEAEAMIA